MSYTAEDGFANRPQPPSKRTRVLRMPERAAYDCATMHAILDEGLVAHLAIEVNGQPYAIPTLHARVGDTVYIHGSAGSRALRTLSAGASACLTVTLIDGLVLARAAVHQSVNYRSAMILGTASRIEDEQKKLQALEQFTERLVPGRWAEVRPPTRKELKQVSVLKMSLAECSAKTRSGPPLDEPQDIGLDVWAGVIPLSLVAGQPESALGLREGLAPSQVIERWAQQRR